MGERNCGTCFHRDNPRGLPCIVCVKHDRWESSYQMPEFDNVRADMMPRNSQRDEPEYVDQRPDWDEYFMGFAHAAKTRATCDRKHVGAVIVANRHVIATGYNGSVPGAKHCDEIGHLMEDGHCVRTVHAEANAICQAALHGAHTHGAVLYTTASPCWPCFKMIAAAGITRVVFGEFYRDDRIFEYARQVGIVLDTLQKK